ncbi:MAG: hypothetical protein K5Q68_03095, partial [Roseococcus sp.]|nr:hypothetical protein [Roseococcus sp.]
MKKPTSHKATRRRTKNIRRAMLAGAALMLAPQGGAALAQACTTSPCNIPAGNLTIPFNATVVTANSFDFTNGAAFTIQSGGTAFAGAIQMIVSGGDGADSTSGAAAGSGGNAGSLTFNNGGAVSHTVPSTTQSSSSLFSVYGASSGGNGGNYTNFDQKHDAGVAGGASSATLVNTGGIMVSTVSPAPAAFTVQTGAALLVESRGGNGGSVASSGNDENTGNPVYQGDGKGHSGANGATARLTNSGAINVTLSQPQVALWYWGAAARSVGGDAGMSRLGRNGGAGGAAFVTNSADVSVSLGWAAQASPPPPMTPEPQPQPVPPPAALGAFAVAAISQGGNATMSVDGKKVENGTNDGGTGGSATSATVSIPGQTTPTNIRLSTSNPLNLGTTPYSAAVAAIGLGGAGGAGWDGSPGGPGGMGGLPSIAVGSNVVITASGDRTRGVFALSQGGIGGGSGVDQYAGVAGSGGSTPSSPTGADWINLTNTSITTSGASSAGVMAASLGGHGGTGEAYIRTGIFDFAEGGTAGAGGAAGTINLTITGGSITTSGAASSGVLALAQGGVGGNGGDAQGGLGAGSGTGGAGGAAGSVTVTINGAASINVRAGSGAAGFGVHAASLGGAGGTGGTATTDAVAGRGKGGAGGHAGDIQITLNPGARVTMGGAGAAADRASAIIGLSHGGQGGAASLLSDGVAGNKDGEGGRGGDAGKVTITSAAALTTFGQTAHGILAQSIGGVGGNGADGAGVGDSAGGGGGASGAAGAVAVTNTGSITTSGFAALGILAQSIGGAGGLGGSGGGSSGTIDGSGGSGGAASGGGSVSVTHGGSITTRGDFGLGILAQSIGGGGGSSGASRGIGAVGGGAGSGGDGADNTITLQQNSSISTTGRLAHGVVAQSIGGGGGNAGDASSTGVVLTLAIGGSGGDGGAGGAVTLIANGGMISASGSNAQGIIAHSIGGGGGTGGSAYTVSGGALFAAAVSLGGSGGKGSAGGAVTATLNGLTISTGQVTLRGTNLNPVDAHGINLQSIGGGGGVGGSASAQALAVGLVIPTGAASTVAGSGTWATGGSGSSGGDASLVKLTLGWAMGAATSNITTQGQGSHGILMQSIGGGGGAGGDSSAMATTTSFGRASSAGEANSFSLELSVTQGGSAGAGGNGGAVTALLDRSNITTFGDYSNGLVVHSIGGGGGNAGVGSSTTLAFGSTRDLGLALNLGSTGGAGGNGGGLDLTLNPDLVIQTYGASAMGLVGQSIGGGGGTSQGGTINLGATYSVSVDGVPTSITPTGSLTVGLGATGGAAGDGGSIKTVMQGRITTSGSDSAGVVLQSIGGGGGIAGSAGAEASSDNPVQPLSRAREVISNIAERSNSLPISAKTQVGQIVDGTSGTGGTITYSQAGAITTRGDWSHGVVAQTIGGGGGLAGVASSLSSNIALASTITVGGARGNGGDISLTFGAASRITTGMTSDSTRSGYAAFGVLAQSIGGGGGIGVDGSTSSNLTLTLGGAGASFGIGGTVKIDGVANIVTEGDVAVGMVLQSIGAGGGVVGSGNSASATVAPGSIPGETKLQVGGTVSAGGSGGAVLIDNASLSITTAGAHAYGVLAQSIDSGGGFGFTPDVTTSVSNALGARISGQTFAGSGGPVTVNIAGGAITTSGFGAHGIVAQSIGGGGGIAGLPTRGATLVIQGVGNTPGAASPNGFGGAVLINSNAPIRTTGEFAHGIFAQSIGGGGGVLVQGNQVFTGTTNAGAAGAVGPGGSVTITQSAPITVSGANSVAIFAQSAGVPPGAPVFITVSSTIQGGAGAKGVGIWSESTDPNSLITITSTGIVSALSGMALQAAAGNVDNFGTVTFSYNLSNASTFNNAGTLLAGPSLIAGELVNTGLVAIASHTDFGVTAVSGNFTQRASGRLLFNADFT